MTRTIAAGLLVAAAAIAALSGCSSGGSGASPTTSATADPQQVLTVGRSFAQCARTHGQPNFPDPTIQNGRLNFGSTDKETMLAVRQACGSILDQLGQSMFEHGAPAASAQDMQHLRQFAQCMRQHGVAQWPDPKPDGSFPLVGTPLETEGKSQRVIDATQACRQYLNNGVSVS